jgi:predicted kinase
MDADGISHLFQVAGIVVFCSMAMDADPGLPLPPVLVIFTGVPGTGKTTLAEQAARWLHAPLFSKDELEATLWRSGIRRDVNSGWAAYELLTTLARNQLQRGQSALLDSVATLERIRAAWRALAVEFDAPLRIVETICSDQAIHRARLHVRQRGIPGWPELGWDEAVQIAERFEPWTEARLVLDAVEPLGQNLAALRRYLLLGEMPRRSTARAPSQRSQRFTMLSPEPSASTRSFWTWTG